MNGVAKNRVGEKNRAVRPMGCLGRRTCLPLNPLKRIDAPHGFSEKNASATKPPAVAGERAPCRGARKNVPRDNPDRAQRFSTIDKRRRQRKDYHHTKSLLVRSTLYRLFLILDKIVFSNDFAISTPLIKSGFRNLFRFQIFIAEIS